MKKWMILVLVMMALACGQDSARYIMGYDFEEDKILQVLAKEKKVNILEHKKKYSEKYKKVRGISNEPFNVNVGLLYNSLVNLDAIDEFKKNNINVYDDVVSSGEWNFKRLTFACSEAVLGTVVKKQLNYKEDDATGMPIGTIYEIKIDENLTNKGLIEKDRSTVLVHNMSLMCEDGKSISFTGEVGMNIGFQGLFFLGYNNLSKNLKSDEVLFYVNKKSLFPIKDNELKYGMGQSLSVKGQKLADVKELIKKIESINDSKNFFNR